MTWDHERVEELLASMVLGGLDPEDAALADRAMAEHVPGCDRCSSAIRGFREVAGDLALLAAPAPPPDLLARRVTGLARAPRRRPAGWVAAGVAVVALAGLSTWTVALDRRLERAETRQAWVLDALSEVGTPEVAVLRLRGQTGRISVLQDRTGDQHYLLASGLPEGTYQVWMVGQGGTWSPGTFDAAHGAAMVPVKTDMDKWHTVMVTEAPEGPAPEPTVSPLASALVDG